MTVLPVVSAPTSLGEYGTWLLIAEAWSVWTHAGVRYQREGENVTAVDADGLCWRWDETREMWIRRIRREVA